MNLSYKLVKGGNVPGGHNVIYDGVREPFITPMQECNSIPLKHTDVVVDIGAYVGTYAIRCARFPVRKVVAYEPTPLSFSILNLTKLVNLESKNVAVVGDDSKTIELYVSRGIGVTNSIVMKGKKDPVTVSAVSFREAVREATIVKIDVEGAEYTYPIIESLHDGIRALIIDFHKVAKTNWREKAETTIEKIRRSGFTGVIEPSFVSGWSLGGSWIRETRELTEVCNNLMEGLYCCGCGVGLSYSGAKSLCRECFNTWSKKHRQGYFVSERI